MMNNLIESGRIWVVAVVGLLLLNVSVCAVTVVAATGDPVASAVEPDYYRKAVDWDDTRAMWPSPETTGWDVRVESRDGRVELVVTDQTDGSRVPGVGGRVEAKHAGASLLVREGELEPGEGGAVVWTPDAGDRGLWSLTIWLERGEQRAWLTRRVMIGG